MATTRVHYRKIAGTGAGTSACGRFINAFSLSRDTGPVTCVKCRESHTFNYAVTSSRLAANLTLRNTPVDPTMKKILDAVFEKAAEIAENEGHCSAYEDMIDEIGDSGVLPEGYDIPGRERDWIVVVQIDRGRIEATSAEEAKKIFIEQFDRHFEIERD